MKWPKAGYRNRFFNFYAKKPLDLRPQTLRLHAGLVTLAPNPRICTFALVGDDAKAKVLGNV
jgi:hypothetical protein